LVDTGQFPLQGRRLADRYVLEEELASGGMGGLWLARDEVLGRQVAVKVLHDHLADDEELLKRFRMEAVAAARLSHPAVVRVFDTGIHDGVCFIVMELVEGRSVEEVLAEQGALRPGEAARIVRGALQALSHAHRQEVIHRDVKPGNILLGRDGIVKLADFGIAKTAFTGGDLTTTGNLLGTSRYLSPEQVTGGEIDARSDIYAAGVVLYELLTGRPPFDAETHIATATMRLTVDPSPPRSLRPGIPRALEAVVMRALAREPAERYQTAEEMSAAIEHVAPSETPQPTSRHEEHLPPRRSARSWIAIPLTLIVLAGLAVGAFMLLEGFDGDTADDPPTDASTGRVRIDQAFAYDPLGDNEEHDEAVGDAIDDDEATYWTTEGYEQDLGIEKEGVGLVVELREAAEVGRVRITTETPGWDFSIFVADDPGDFDPEGTPARDADVADSNGTYVIDPPVEGQYVLIWITGLVESDGWRAHINEVGILSPGE
jgi:eukaryotic-like serine/threonine-protein kinase